MPHAKRRKAVLQSDAALDGEEGRDLALPLGLADIGGGERAHEDIGMRVAKLMDGVDQLEDGARRLLRGRGDVGCPDLRAEPPFLEARNVGVRVLMHAGEVITPHIALGLAIAADDEGKIIVPIDQGQLVEKTMRMRKRVGRGCGLRHGGSRRSQERRIT